MNSEKSDKEFKIDVLNCLNDSESYVVITDKEVIFTGMSNDLTVMIGNAILNEEEFRRMILQSFDVIAQDLVDEKMGEFGYEKE